MGEEAVGDAVGEGSPGSREGGGLRGRAGSSLDSLGNLGHRRGVSEGDEDAGRGCRNNALIVHQGLGCASISIDFRPAAGLKGSLWRFRSGWNGFDVWVDQSDSLGV